MNVKKYMPSMFIEKQIYFKIEDFIINSKTNQKIFVNENYFDTVGRVKELSSSKRKIENATYDEVFLEVRIDKGKIPQNKNIREADNFVYNSENYKIEEIIERVGYYELIGRLIK